MRPSGHAVVSCIVASGVWWWTRDGWMAVLSWIVGVGVDLDHVIDYMMHERRLPTSVKEFLDYYLSRHGYPRVVILFHGYEWLLGLILLAWAWWPTMWITVVTLSYAQHLVLDLLANKHVHPLCYFVAFRIHCGFSRAVLIRSGPAALQSNARTGSSSKG